MYGYIVLKEKKPAKIWQALNYLIMKILYIRPGVNN